MNSSTLRVDLSFQPDGARVAAGRSVAIHVSDGTELLARIVLFVLLFWLTFTLDLWRSFVISGVMSAYGIILFGIVIKCLAGETAKLIAPPLLLSRR